MPRRLLRIHAGITDFARRDPTLMVALFAAWSIMSGLSLVSVENSFKLLPTYAVAMELGFNDNIVGSGMIIDGIALLWSLGGSNTKFEASIVLTTALLWGFWGFLLIGGGAKAGFFSSAGGWCVLAAVALLLCSSGTGIHQADKEVKVQDQPATAENEADDGGDFRCVAT